MPPGTELKRTGRWLPRVPNQEVLALYLKLHSKAVVLTDAFVPLSLPAEVRQCLQTFLMVSISGVEVLLHLVIEAKAASKHSTMHRTALHHTDDQVQVLSQFQVEKL